MHLINQRIQYAVGQGGFHAATVIRSDGPDLTYVVDCGAMTAYAADRNRCIDAYLKKRKPATGGRGDLDFLFITHAHADHLNGVARLLDKKSGVHAKTVVMPMLTVVERLATFARTATVDPKSAGGRFYIDFTLDPIDALSQFGPRQIVLVSSGDSDAGAPFSRDVPGPDSGQLTPRPLTDTKRDDASPQVVGVGSTAVIPSSAKTVKHLKMRGVPEVVAMPDTLGFVYDVPGSPIKWLIAPFLDPAVKVETATFVKELAKQLGFSVKKLLDWLDADMANVESLLTVDLPKLIEAYKAVEKDLNVTSLCIYSGPVVPHPASHAHVCVGVGTGWHVVRLHGPDTKLGWLGTGDAALKEKARRSAFLTHYGRLLQQVHTFMVPHHGSEGNFDKALVEAIKPLLCVAAADYVPNWRHPGTRVVQDAASYGAGLSVVTSSPASQIYEEIYMG